MNLYAHLARAADRTPDAAAIHAPRWDSAVPGAGHDTLRFGELHRDAGRLAGALRRRGVGAGDRVVLMVPVSLDLYRVVAALFRVGAVPVLLDPWMGIARMADCIRRTAPALFIGIPAAHALFLWRRGLRGLARVRVGGAGWLGGPSLDAWLREDRPLDGWAERPADAPALITFTGGSTGRPKGVERSHAILDAQHRGTAACMGLAPGDVHLQAFPNMVLSHIASGATSVIPWFRQGRAAAADGAALVRQIRRLGVTSLCGPPALMRALVDHCDAHDVELRGVRRVLVGGSAVGFDLLRRLDRRTRPGAPVVLYGSSEAEPLATLGDRRQRRDAERRLRRGGGLCMGTPSTAVGVELLAVPPHDGPLAVDAAGLRAMALPPGAIGELLVRGDHVARRYFGDDEATRRTKVDTGDGGVWHRLGDLGYLDDAGRVFLVGRVNDAVRAADRTLYPLAVEPVVDELSFVARSGLVAVGDDGAARAVLAYQRSARGRGPTAADRRARVQRALARAGAAVDEVLEVARVPVDARHNGKVDHAALARICATHPALRGWVARRAGEHR